MLREISLESQANTSIRIDTACELYKASKEEGFGIVLDICNEWAQTRYPVDELIRNLAQVVDGRILSDISYLPAFEGTEYWELFLDKIIDDEKMVTLLKGQYQTSLSLITLKCLSECELSILCRRLLLGCKNWKRRRPC